MKLLRRLLLVVLIASLIQGAGAPVRAAGIPQSDAVAVNSAPAALGASGPFALELVQEWTVEDSGGAMRLAGGDFDNDGFRDLLVIEDAQIQLYQGRIVGVDPTPALTLTLPGFTVAEDPTIDLWAVADFNDDGFDDLALLIPSGTNGSVAVYSGSMTGLSAAPTQTTAVLTQPQRLAAGDFNGDGMADVAVLQSATVAVFSGSAAGLNGAPQTISAPTGMTFGPSLTVFPDTNGDGYADLGLLLVQQAAYESATAVVYQGTAAGIAGTPAVRLHNPPAVELKQLVNLGDINGDGYSDAGFYYRPEGEISFQMAVFSGTADGVDPDPWLFWRWPEQLMLGDTLPALSAAGDINGDGYADIIIGPTLDATSDASGACVVLGHSHGLEPRCDAYAPMDDGANSNPRGRVVGVGPMRYLNNDDLGLIFTANDNLVHIGLYKGNTGGALPQPDPVLTDGATVTASAGDINGDGYGDLLRGNLVSRTVSLFLGSLTGAAPTATWSYTSTAADYGAVLEGVGDVNNDGYADVVAGSSSALDVFFGSAMGLSSTPDWSLTDSAGGLPLPVGLGDVNGDDFGDLLIGFPASGQVKLYPGSASGPAATATWTITDGPGLTLAAAGDIDADGYADALIGVPEAANGNGGFGLLRGGSGGLTPSWSQPGTPGSQLGTSVLGAGDVNGDGYADVAVGAPGAREVQIFRGGPGGPSEPRLTLIQTLRDPRTSAMLGYGLTALGDIDRDGYSDVGVEFYIPEAPGVVLRLYTGSPAGLDRVPFETLPVGFPASLYRPVVAADTTGDGVAEIFTRTYYANQSLRSYTPATLLPVMGQTTSRRIGTPYLLGYQTVRLNDINGDGLDDTGMIELGTSGGFFERVSIAMGSTDPLSSPLQILAEPDQFTKIESAGDVNGDGYSDMLLITPDALSTTLYLGGVTGITPEQSWTEYDAAGGVGDVNGDGYADVLLAGPDDLVLLAGSPTGLLPVPIWESAASPGISLLRILPAGDVNGDGYDDALLLANNGSATILYGAADGFNPDGGWSTPVANIYADGIAPAGDVNGDGYADIATSSSHAVSVFYGSASGLAGVPDWIYGGPLTGMGGNLAVDGGIDVNGDGFDELIIGWKSTVSWSMGQGRAAVFLGSATGLEAQPAWIHDEPRVEQDGTNTFGWSVTGLGDIDGDGLGDLAVGEFTVADELPSIAVFSPLAAPGRPLRPQQRSSAGAAPVAINGVAQDAAFRVAVDGYAPHGRARVRLEWEVRPTGTAFTGVPMGHGGWTNTGTAGAALSSLVAGLAEQTDYSWRVRLAYHPGDLPATAVSAWFTRGALGQGDVALHTGLVVPRLTLAGAAVPEGNSGQTTASLTVTLVPASTRPVTVTFQSLDGTATAGADYVPLTTTLVFAPGETAKTLPVTVMGDRIAEGDETFMVQIASIINAEPVASEATVVIHDDDTAGVAVDPAALTLAEGSATTLTLVLDSQPEATVTVTLAISDSAQATVTPALLVFTPQNWSSPQTATVSAIDDGLVEGDHSTTLLIHTTSADSQYAALADQSIAIAIVDAVVSRYTVFIPLLRR